MDSHSNNQDIGKYSLKLVLNILVPIVFVLALIFFFIGDETLDADTRAEFLPAFIITDLFLLAAWVFLYSGHLRLARMVTIWTASAIIVFAISFTGGMGKSVAAPTLLLPPMLVFCLYGGKNRWIVSVAVVLPLLFTEALVKILGIEIKDYTSTINSDANTLITVGACYFMMYGVLGSLTTANLRLKESLQKERDRNENLANQDLLTGLSNRRGFNSEFHAISFDTMKESSFVVLYLDLDRFKPINDQHGHEAGDYALKIVADRLVEALPDAISIGRLGGDEFAIIHPKASHPRFMQKLCADLKEAIKQPFFYKELSLSVSTSIGYATIPRQEAKLEIVLATADRRMIENKISHNVERRKAIVPSAISANKKTDTEARKQTRAS